MKKPARTWAQLIGLGAPLLIVGVAAMMISFATLIDVAKINGLPFPTMFPILIDVGMVQSMIVASQFKLRGVKGTWLAYLTFTVLSVVSIVANSTHALTTADMTVTSPMWAAMIAATPPATLLATTHLVMMLIPDQKERQRLQSIRDKQQATAVVSGTSEKSTTTKPKVEATPVASAALQTVGVRDVVSMEGKRPTLEIVSQPESSGDEETVAGLIRDYISEHGVRPTGKIVGEWLGGKSAKTGQRFIAKLAETGELEAEISEPLMLEEVAR